MSNIKQTFADLVEPLKKLEEVDTTEVYYESNIELCHAHHRGYNRAIADVSRFMRVNGYNVAWLTDLIKDLQHYEDDSFRRDTLELCVNGTVKPRP